MTTSAIYFILYRWHVFRPSYLSSLTIFICLRLLVYENPTRFSSSIIVLLNLIVCICVNTVDRFLMARDGKILHYCDCTQRSVKSNQWRILLGRIVKQQNLYTCVYIIIILWTTIIIFNNHKLRIRQLKREETLFKTPRGSCTGVPLLINYYCHVEELDVLLH